MRLIAAFLCCSILAFAQDKPAPDAKPDGAKPECAGCGDAGGKECAKGGACCAKVGALVEKIKATEDAAACAKMLLAEIPGFACEKTAAELVTTIKATEDKAACAKLVRELAAKCAPKAADCCPEKATCCPDEPCDGAGACDASNAGFCGEKAAKLVATVKATACPETCAKMLLAEIPGFGCEKTAAELVAKIKATECNETCAKLLGEVALRCAKAAVCPTALKLAAAIRVMSNDEVAAKVLVAEVKGLTCSVMAGKVVAALKKAESDEAAAKMLMRCAAKCAAKAAGDCDKGGCGGCDKGEAAGGCGGCDQGEAKAEEPKAGEAKK